MAFLSRSLPAGIVIGVAAGAAAREVFPAIGAALRPLARTTMRGAIIGYEKLREGFAYVGESVEDLSSEVRSELTAGPEAGAGAGAEAERGEKRGGKGRGKDTGKETGETRQAV